MLLKKFKNSTLFEGVSKNYLDELEDCCEEVTLKAGDTLFRQGDTGKGMYLIINGEIDILIEGSREKNRCNA